MTCKECLHYEVCADFRRNICETDQKRFEEYKINSNGICDNFKNKSDYAKVKRGKWIQTNDDNKKRCSNCDVIHLIAQYPNGQANYCPNCSAKMTGKDTNVLSKGE